MYIKATEQMWAIVSKRVTFLRGSIRPTSSQMFRNAITWFPVFPKNAGNSLQQKLTGVGPKCKYKGIQGVLL